MALVTDQPEAHIQNGRETSFENTAVLEYPSTGSDFLNPALDNVRVLSSTDSSVVLANSGLRTDRYWNV